MATLRLYMPKDGETLETFLKRVDVNAGESLLLFGHLERQLREPEVRSSILQQLSKQGSVLRLATSSRSLAAAARAKGLRVIDRVADLRSLLGEHPQLTDALRTFSPHLWRQQLRSRLQAMGLLSLPKVRIWLLIALSTALFLFVAFRLLPAAEIAVEPREDVVTQAANIFLVQSGAVLTDEVSPRVRSIPLVPVRVRIDRTITFDRISKEFIGQSAQVEMTIKNRSAEPYRLRGGSRVANQAGMVFQIDTPFTVEPGEELTVPAVADDMDLYDEIIGERGNVPANLEWYFIGLDPAERADLFVQNRAAATGGVTAHRTVLKPEDLQVAEAELKEELLRSANQLVDEQLQLQNVKHPDRDMTRLYYDELTKASFSGVTLPTEFLGEQVTSVPVTGTLLFESYAYDRRQILDLLRGELEDHVEVGRELVPTSVTLDRLVAHVISYADDFSWIKLTVDLSGTQRFVLDPLTPAGAHFAKNVREAVQGKTPAEAERITENLPEVHRAAVSMWPPWSRRLPTIPYHIRVTVISQ